MITIAAVLMLALMAGLLGAAKEFATLRLLQSNFAARMMGYAVAVLVVLAGSIGPFHLGSGR